MPKFWQALSEAQPRHTVFATPLLPIKPLSTG